MLLVNYRDSRTPRAGYIEQRKGKGPGGMSGTTRTDVYIATGFLLDVPPEPFLSVGSRLRGISGFISSALVLHTLVPYEIRNCTVV